MTHPTVCLESVGIPYAIRMRWEHEVLEPDVKTAFNQLFTLVDKSLQPMYIIVDLTSDPQFPLIETMMSALPSYRHRQVAAWLVVGSNKFARYISQFLGTASQRSNVQWFDNETEAMNHMQDMLVR